MKEIFIPMGYKVKSGEILIDCKNAEIIQAIFDAYIAGQTLKQIADDLNITNTKYKDGEKIWNKNIICRIIENQKYCGNEHYPEIISGETFKIANNIKQTKGHFKIETTPIIDCISGKLYCEKCYGNYRRIINKKMKVGKWQCKNGCKCLKTISDDFIINEVTRILNILIENKNLALIDKVQTYTPSLKVTELNNEINRMLQTNNPEFEQTKELILECASQRFNGCKLDSSGYVTDDIIKILEQKTDILSLLQNVVSRILINTDLAITIKLKNGKILQRRMTNV